MRTLVQKHAGGMFLARGKVHSVMMAVGMTGSITESGPETLFECAAMGIE